MSRYFTRLRIRRFYSWGGRPYSINRKLKTFYYDSLCLKTDGHPEPCIIKPGQNILIEGDDEDYPYVAKLLKLFSDESGKVKRAEVQWFIRFTELPHNKRKLLGRMAHPQEVFFYQDKTCDTEIDAETITGTVQVMHLAPDAAFPEKGSKSTLYVKLCWDTKAFRPLEVEWVQPGTKPAPPPAPVPRSLPTPDVAVMKQALSVSLRQVSMSAGKVGLGEAESSHSSSKLSASKALSRKRRGNCEALPGVRKKLDLSSPGKRLTVDNMLDELLVEEVQSEMELARKMSASPPQSSARMFSLSPIKVTNKCAAVTSLSRLTGQNSPCPIRSPPLPEQDSARVFGSTPLGEEAWPGDAIGSSSATTPRRSSRRALKAQTPSHWKESSSSALREPALGSVAEEPLVDQEAETPRSKRKSAQLVSSRIRKQLNLLNTSQDPISEDSEDDCFLPSKELKSSSENEEGEEGEEDGSDNDIVTVKKRRQTTVSHTPRSTRKGSALARTPRRTPSKKALPTTPRTPRHATPSIPARSLPARKPGNVLEEARARLHVSSVPESLPCREQEFQDIYSFVDSKIVDGIGGCMYISGVPGTGKTATVHEVIRSLRQAAELDEIPSFRVLEINGMKMTDPHQAYVQILQKLTGQKATADHAAALLEKRFSSPAPKKETTVLVVDELDLLWTRKQNVMYNLFDWPTRRHARLVVLAIANTMDLPERIMINRVASRLGLTRMSFQPYTFKQLQQIITSRLNHVKAFEEDALQLVSRKVAALSGDARRCLDICRRATEICEHSGARQSGPGLVGMSHVMEALDEMFSSSYITAIRCASVQEQLFLRAVLAEFRRLGLEEATFQQVFVQHQALCRMEGLQPVNVSEGLAVCQRLGACRLLLLESSRLDVLLRVRLNVSQDDVLYALKED